MVEPNANEEAIVEMQVLKCMHFVVIVVEKPRGTQIQALVLRLLESKQCGLKAQQSV